MLSKIKRLIDKGFNAHQIGKELKAQGNRVYCFGSYYTIEKICFYETDNGIKCARIN